MTLLYNEDWLWIVILGFVVAFILAFGLGANDVANAFGTSVGSKVITLRQACVLGSIFEMLGAILVGAKVSDTIRKGIVSPDLYTNGTEEVFMAGNVAALSGSCLWLIVATFLKLPVSGTHSIVGGTVGFSLVVNGLHGINFGKLAMIAASWVISPLLSGFVSSMLFKFINHFILSKEKQLEPGLMFLPLFYAVTLGVNIFSVFYKGSEMLWFNRIPLYGTFIITVGGAIITAVVVKVILVPYMRRKITGKSASIEDEETVALDNKETPNKQGSHTPAEMGGRRSSERSLATVYDGKHYYRVSKSILVPLDNVNAHVAMHRDGRLKIPGSLSSLGKYSGGPAGALLHRHMSVPAHHSSLHSLRTHLRQDNNSQTGSIEGHKPGPEMHTLPMPQITGAKTPDSNSVKDGHIHPDDGQSHGDVISRSISMDGNKAPLDMEEEVIDTEILRELARAAVTDTPESAELFSFLQILTAIFGSFAHGGNDVSNCIGPLVAIWITAVTGSSAQKAPVPIWVLVYGGVGISVGLWVWGRRVMKTMGEDLTRITPSSGFCIEIGSALTVLFASNLGIPISTTHCKVGSVVCVGRMRSRESVDWKLFSKIILAWFVTLPVAGGLSAAVMAIMKAALEN